MASHSSTLAWKIHPMDGGAWWAADHGVNKSLIQLSDFTFTFHFHPLQKEMATHSTVLAWRIPGTGEPGGLLSMGSHRVGHDWSDLAVASYGGGNEDNGDLLQKVPCTHGYTQCPQLQQATADPRLHRGLLDTHRQVCFGIIFIYLKKQIQGGQIDQEIDSISPYVKEESNWEGLS